MLNIVFGRENAPEGYVLDTRYYFKDNYEDAWFQNPFVQEFILKVGRCKHIMETVFSMPNGNCIVADKIPAGCQALCSMYFNKYEDRFFYGLAIADKYIAYLIEIAKKKKVCIILEHFMDIDKHYFSEDLIFINGSPVSYQEYLYAYNSWCSSSRIIRSSEETFEVSELCIYSKERLVSTLQISGRYTCVYENELENSIEGLLNDISTGALRVVVPEGWILAVANKATIHVILQVQDPCIVLVDELSLFSVDSINKVLNSNHLFIVLNKGYGVRKGYYRGIGYRLVKRGGYFEKLALA